MSLNFQLFACEDKEYTFGDLSGLLYRHEFQAIDLLIKMGKDEKHKDSYNAICKLHE